MTNADDDSWGYSDGTSAYQDSGEPIYTSSRWESSDASFDYDGIAPDPTANVDYRSAAWHEIAPAFLMVKWNGDVLFTTTTSCFGGASSLSDFFASMSWGCGGSADIVGCSTSCSVLSNVLSGEDALGIGSTFSSIYFKVGESDGAQDTNKDRAYIRTTMAATSVDNPAGLGSFCSSTVSSGCNGHTGSMDAGQSDDGVLRANTSPYTLYIMTGGI